MAKISKSKLLWQKLRDERDDSGSAYINAKDVSVLLRDRLKKEFPGTKFSVRTEHHTAINISWTDGPYKAEVEEISGNYSFGGFDGMIDMAYSVDNWMLPDGSIVFAKTSGTEGSRGSVTGRATDCPEHGAIIVSGGAKYVFCHREMSDSYRDKLAVETCNFWGGMTYNPLIPTWEQPARKDLQYGGVWNLSDMMHRFEQNKARDLLQAKNELNLA